MNQDKLFQEAMDAAKPEDDKARNLELANTILSQMGGTRRLAAMIGAKGFLALKAGSEDKSSEGGVTFSFPNRERSRGNAVTILLMPSDTYKVMFFNGSKVVKVYDDVYADSLMDIFESQTGLYLTMAPRR